MPTATQLPFLGQPATRTGRKLFRKMVLPIGTVRHPDHGELHFTAERLAKLREAFLNGPTNQTPFVLVDAGNRHSDDPERFRGEVTGLEVAADGLLATIETTDGGTRLLTDNPNLPVSVRIKALEDGREVLAHVAGTFDPVWKNTGPWEAIDAADGTEVRDLSSQAWYKTVPVTEPQTPPAGQTPPAADLSAEEEGKFRLFLTKLGIVAPTEQTPPAGSNDEPLTLTDDELQAMLAATDGDATTETREPVAATLSDEDRATLDLANERAERAEVRAGKAELSNRLDGYLSAGVPPVLVSAAKAQLIGDTDEHKAVAMDFANGKEPAAAKALFAALDAAKGTIDFSERGSAVVDTEAEARKAKLDAWEKSSG